MISTIDSILEHCSAWILAYLPTLFSALSSMLIAFFLGIYDGKPIWKIVSEPFICGIFTLAISGSLEYLGLPDTAVNLMGGIIGFVGVAKIRELIDSKLTQRLGAGNHENQR
ncbi:phage holin, lambda family [Erwinia endophytica]|uniref:phage holin, lambda family n=1 Tax=Erwinia endophytica TaxID=1563158 RepID=UPI001265F3F4|nr:phage holin, lambda family [Erwinia endophytica]KAB8307561.1 phage holin, lambda family [Erwinia endophytica]